jgi:hypothetical protein
LLSEVLLHFAQVEVDLTRILLQDIDAHASEPGVELLLGLDALREVAHQTEKLPDLGAVGFSQAPVALTALH